MEVAFSLFSLEYIEFGPGIVAHTSFVCFKDEDGTSNSTYNVPCFAYL